MYIIFILFVLFLFIYLSFYFFFVCMSAPTHRYMFTVINLMYVLHKLTTAIMNVCNHLCIHISIYLSSYEPILSIHLSISVHRSMCLGTFKHMLINNAHIHGFINIFVRDSRSKVSCRDTNAAYEATSSL